MARQTDLHRGEAPTDDLTLMHAGAAVLETGQMPGGWRYLIWVRQKGAGGGGVAPLLVAEASAYSDPEVYGFQLERVEQTGPSPRDIIMVDLFDQAGYNSVEDARSAMESRYIRATHHNPLDMMLALAAHWLAGRLAWARGAVQAIRTHPVITLLVLAVIALMVWFAFAWVFPVYLGLRF